jgi:hypothetical protein
MNTFHFKILPDGSGKLESGSFADGDHFRAEEFLKTLATRLGGGITQEAKDPDVHSHEHHHHFEEEHEYGG